MSSNKGKDGELRVLILTANIGRIKDGVDVTRPTITNSADQGADEFITHPVGFLNEIAEIAGSIVPSTRHRPTKKESHTSEKSRIDVKTTNNKLQKDTVDKFISDCHNHPKCTGHILMGGADLTGPAKKVFEAAQNRFSPSGKTLLYVNNEGIRKLEEYYQPKVESDEKELIQ
jgi:hypothetical protein